MGGDDTETVKLVERKRLVAILRLDDLNSAVELSRALVQGGVVVQEYTLTNPAALEAIQEVREAVPEFQSGDAALGVGSVRTLAQVHAAIDAKVDFVVTPILLPDVVELCLNANVPIFPGCFTPTEIAKAWSLGAQMIKVFPARQLGPGFIKDVLAPMPELKLMPTGGIDLENMPEYFSAGATAVGIGGRLLDAAAIETGNWKQITESARVLSSAAIRT